MGKSFHPKAYLFNFENGEGLLNVGSSNFSMSAMRMGMEWNLAMNAKAEPYTFQVALDKFMQNFYHDSTLPLNTIVIYDEEYCTCHRKNPELFRMITEMEEDEYCTENTGKPDEKTVTAKFAQIDALEATDCVFASIYTLGMKKYRESFMPDQFDLIVVDEFHHAAAVSYQSVIQYFKPKILLGITATPDRMDGKDVYVLCDGNVAYQIHFIEAIRRGWLSPFQYFGVYDDTDHFIHSMAWNAL